MDRNFIFWIVCWKCNNCTCTVYIAGYLTAKSKKRDLYDSHLNYEMYGGFTVDLN